MTDCFQDCPRSCPSGSHPPRHSSLCRCSQNTAATRCHLAHWLLCPSSPAVPPAARTVLGSYVTAERMKEGRCKVGAAGSVRGADRTFSWWAPPLVCAGSHQSCSPSEVPSKRAVGSGGTQPGGVGPRLGSLAQCPCPSQYRGDPSRKCACCRKLLPKPPLIRACRALPRLLG